MISYYEKLRILLPSMLAKLWNEWKGIHKESKFGSIVISIEGRDLHRF